MISLLAVMACMERLEPSGPPFEVPTTTTTAPTSGTTATTPTTGTTAATTWTTATTTFTTPTTRWGEGYPRILDIHSECQWLEWLPDGTMASEDGITPGMWFYYVSFRVEDPDGVRDIYACKVWDTAWRRSEDREGTTGDLDWFCEGLVIDWYVDGDCEAGEAAYVDLEAVDSGGHQTKVRHLATP